MTSRQTTTIPAPVVVGGAGGINAYIPDRKELAATTPSVNFKPPVDGGCSSTRYGCCSDGKTPKEDEKGTNCPGYKPLLGDQSLPTYTPPGFCANTVYGCCSDGMIAKIDEFGSNCPRSRPTTTGGLSSLLAVRVINQLFPPRDPRPRVGLEDLPIERLDPRLR